LFVVAGEINLCTSTMLVSYFIILAVLIDSTDFTCASDSKQFLAFILY